MLVFSKLTLDELSLYRDRFGCNRDRICDCTAGTTFMWRDFFQTEYTIFDGSLILKFRYIDGKTAFAFPLCGDCGKALSEIYEYCRENGELMRFCFTSKRDRDIIASMYGTAESTEERDWFDYVYNAADLVSLSGKKYHGQKNFVNRFKKMYPNYKFTQIDGTNIARVREYVEAHIKKYPKEGAYISAETHGIFEALEHHDLYGMCGGFVEVDGVITGISMGEIVGDTLYVHIEKADTEYQGAYPILTNEFAKAFAGEEILYINREEDMGEEGLRRSKEAYHPVFMAEKYTVTVK
jgi:Uncharacterized conserved protein